MMKLRKGITGLTKSGGKRILPEFISLSLARARAHARTHTHTHTHTSNLKEKGRNIYKKHCEHQRVLGEALIFRKHVQHGRIA